MSRATSLFATIAMVPALCGPLLAPVSAIALPLCGGGTLSLPLRDGPAPPATEPCCSKGCRSERKRNGRRSGGDA